jgi:hypothetical protein
MCACVVCLSKSHLEDTLELADQVLHLSLHTGRQLCNSLALAGISTACLACSTASAASLTRLHATLQ